ncbi:MAG: OmpA family protein [Candidatus Krumholzibacteriia bacterium]
MHVPRARSTVVTFALVLAWGLVGAVPAAAQEDYSNRIGVFLGGGYAKYVGSDIDHSELSPILLGGVRVGWRRHIDITGAIRYGSFDAVDLPDTDLLLSNQTTQLEFGVLYSHDADASWTPQAVVGAGITYWNVFDLTDQSSQGLFADGPPVRGFKEDGHRARLQDTNFNLFFGLGAEFGIFGRTSLQVGGRIDWLPKQETDNTGASSAHGDSLANIAHVDANDFFPSVYVSLSYFFSERDSDQDGIRNQDDRCPYEAEDVDGYQDSDGCPDPDNDGDGVQDAVDACPDEAEDVDGFEDDDGCPDPDNDGDGVLDASDQCPDTPSGVNVGEAGCPTAARIDSATVIEGVRFVPSGAELDPASYAALDSVVESLHAYPDLEVEIQGHTSNVGPADQNALLSQRRAEVVAQYFVEKGIESRRLTPIGYGEEAPMVDNDTPENRARNERIVIVPVQDVPLESMDIDIETPENRDSDDENED